MQLDKVDNPFIANLAIPYREIPIGYDEKTNDPLHIQEVEIEPHYRVFNSKAKRQKIFSLSIYARDMYMAIQYFTHKENQYVVISYEKMEKLLGDGVYGKRRFEDTIRELIRHSIIDYKDKERNQYWYNPIYYSPYNRLRLFPTAYKYNVDDPDNYKQD